MVEDGEFGSIWAASQLRPTVSYMVFSSFTKWSSICKPLCLRWAGMADHSCALSLTSTCFRGLSVGGSWLGRGGPQQMCQPELR